MPQGFSTRSRAAKALSEPERELSQLAARAFVNVVENIRTRTRQATRCGLGQAALRLKRPSVRNQAPISLPAKRDALA